MEKFHYNLNDIPQSVLEEMDREMERNPRFNADEFYKSHGILPISEAKEVVPVSNSNKEQKMARAVFRALNLIAGGNKTAGMIKAEDEIHPNVAHIDPSVIAAGRERLDSVYGRAEKLLRSSMGSQALAMVVGVVEPDNKGSYVDLVQDRLFGQDNKNERARVRSQVKKLAGIKAKAR